MPGIAMSEKNQVDVGAAVERLDRGFGARRLDDAAPALLKVVGRDRRNVGIVLDEQHPCPLEAGGIGTDRRRCGLDGTVCDRQEHGESAPAANSGCNGDRTVALLDEAVHLAETQTGPLIDRLGGEERFENALLDIGGNPEAGVGNRYRGEFTAQVGRQGIVRRVNTAHGDFNLAAARHCVASIERQVEQRDLQFGAIDLHRDQLARKMKVEFGIATDRLRQDSTQRIDAGDQVDHLRRKGAAPSEREQPLGQALSLLDGKLDHFQGTQLPPIRPQSLEFPRRAPDHHQQIVEVVRHPAGELAEGLKPLRLFERVLGGLAPARLVIEPARAPQG